GMTTISSLRSMAGALFIPMAAVSVFSPGAFMVFSLMSAWDVALQWEPVDLKAMWAELDVGRIRGLGPGANVRWLTDTLGMRGRMPRLRNSRWADRFHHGRIRSKLTRLIWIGPAE